MTYIAGIKPLLMVIGSKFENLIEMAMMKANKIKIASIVTDSICDRFSPIIEKNFLIYMPQRIANFINHPAPKEKCLSTNNIIAL